MPFYRFRQNSGMAFVFIIYAKDPFPGESYILGGRGTNGDKILTGGPAVAGADSEAIMHARLG